MGCSASTGATSVAEVSPADGKPGTSTTAAAPISEAAVSHQQPNASPALKLEENDSRQQRSAAPAAHHEPTTTAILSFDAEEDDEAPAAAPQQRVPSPPTARPAVPEAEERGFSSRQGQGSAKFEALPPQAPTRVVPAVGNRMEVELPTPVRPAPAPMFVARPPSPLAEVEAPPSRPVPEAPRAPAEERHSATREGSVKERHSQKEERASDVHRRPSQVIDQHDKGFFDFSALPARPRNGDHAEPITIQDSPPEPEDVDPWASLQTQYRVKSMKKKTLPAGNQQHDDDDDNHGSQPMRETSARGEGGNSVGAARGAGGRRAAPPPPLRGELVLDDVGGGLKAVKQDDMNMSVRTTRVSACGNGGGWDKGHMAKAGDIMVDDDMDLNNYGATHSVGAPAPPPGSRAPPPQKYNGQANNDVGEMGLEDLDADAMFADELQNQGLSPELAAKLRAFDAMNNDDD